MQPSVKRQSEEVVAMETHVLPLVKDLTPEAEQQLAQHGVTRGEFEEIVSRWPSDG